MCCINQTSGYSHPPTSPLQNIHAALYPLELFMLPQFSVPKKKKMCKNTISSGPVWKKSTLKEH